MAKQRNYQGDTMRSITVRELKALLEDQDEDREVIFSTDYGDYHRTPQALPMAGEIEEVAIVKSAYSNSGFAVLSEDDDQGDEDDRETYLLIK